MKRPKMRTTYSALLVTVLILFTQKTYAAPPQDSQCLGNSGPVQAIYLHGWFPPSGNNWLIGLESDNRGKLLKLAAMMNIRIAVPTSQFTMRNKDGLLVRYWPSNQTSIAYAEKIARAACGGAELANDRYMIGFSNGANRTWALSNETNCANMKNYKKILALGPASSSQTAKACAKKTVVKMKHEVPKAETLLQLLQ